MSKNKNATIEEDSVDLKKLIGGRIKRARRKLNRSALWVSERVGLTRSGLSQIENGKSNINAVTLWKVASVLRVNINDFFPTVPESSSLDSIDLETIRREDREAAEFMEKAFSNKTK